jgi:zinc D-Ala-D-Ala carboxypeptidase
MGDLSAHFSLAEFRCHGAGEPGHREHAVLVSPRLVPLLEELRAIVGKPCRIVSGHRCVAWNAHVGGAQSSRHVIGQAADLEAGYATPAQAEQAGFTGIGNLGAWATHVDVRPHAARWHY